ncbi:MAG: septal ring lytic transglycosylase RlpA family protein [Methylophilales bacterium]|nr:septal ring lytic transglycosylase RlpA family protein [Pseudomonadota bacterium]NQW34565.1 septal ring lytic transglycosylase RlpA family protein [Methylophilales bacterium]
MTKIISILFIFLLFGCQAMMPKENSESNSNAGGYYLDDGPHKETPEDLDKIPNAVPKKETLNSWASRPYLAFDQKYIPMTELKPHNETGYASWYGKKYHGNKTSIGEVYNMYEMTGAHKTLPLPCYVKVTNLINQKSVVIRVNDRGPFVKNRIIDLSYAAAHRLEIIEKGSELVKVEVIDPSSTSIQELNQEEKFYIQIGAFSDQGNAIKLLGKISEINLDKMTNKITKKAILYSVMIGPYATKSSADVMSKLLSDELKVKTFVILEE